MAADKVSHLRGIGPLLRLCTLVAAAITIILLGAALSVSRTFEYGSLWLATITFPFPVYSLLWCAVAILVLFFRGSYHPGIDVAFDLIGWGANWGWSWLVFLDAAWLNCDYYYYGYDGHPSHKYVCQQAHVLRGLLFTIGVLMVLYGATHFALFVMACKATHQRRLRKKRGYTIELDDMEPLGPRKPPSK